MGAGLAGKRAVLSIDMAWTDGTDPASPTWTEVKPSVDLEMSGDKGDADISSRESTWMLRDGALKDGTISFGYRPRQGADTTYDKLVDSWLNDVPLLVALTDQPTDVDGSKGWQMVVIVMSLGESYPHTDGALVSVTMSPYPGVDASGNIIEPSRLNITVGP